MCCEDSNYATRLETAVTAPLNTHSQTCKLNHTFIIFHAVPVSCHGPVNVARSMGYSKVQQNQNTGLPDVIIPLKSVCHLSWLLAAGVHSPGECHVCVKAPPCLQPRVATTLSAARLCSCAGSCSPHPGPHNNAARHQTQYSCLKVKRG